MAEDPKQKKTEEDLDELKEVIKKFEELRRKNEEQQKKQQQKPKRPMLAIEIGGVYHHNKVINTLFTFVVNAFFAYFVIELFGFAEYHGQIEIFLLVVALYTVLEDIYRTFVLTQYFQYIIKSFGTIFYFGYLLLFYIIDQFIFINSFNFINETLLAFFVLIFALTRYFFATSVRRFLRRPRK